MELSAHHVVIMTGEDTNAGSRLPIPNADCLIVGGAKNPRIFMMESSRADIIQMTQQSENASLLLIVPNLKSN